MNEKLATGDDGTRLYVRARPGPASPEPRPTAILSDGIACDGFIWKYLWRELAELMPVAHWNYRGHGRSEKPRDPARVEFVDHVSDLAAVRRAVASPAGVVLFGHSMGCQVALESYHRQPEGVRALVLVCGSSGRITHTFRGTDVLAQMLPRIIEQVERHPHVARALWGRVPADLSLWIGKLMGDFDVASVRIADLVPYMHHMVDIDLPMFLRMLRSAGEHDAEPYLPEIRVPVLVVGGDRDAFTPPQYAENLASRLPDAELFLLHRATHVAPLERREQVGERVREFLERRVLALPEARRGTAAP